MATSPDRIKKKQTIQNWTSPSKFDIAQAVVQAGDNSQARAIESQCLSSYKLNGILTYIYIAVPHVNLLGTLALVPTLQVQYVLEHKELLKYNPYDHLIPGQVTVLADFRLTAELGVGGFKTCHPAQLMANSLLDTSQYPGLTRLSNMQHIRIKQIYAMKDK